ncbi:hypothetical protein [Marinigracilibium pacificum]|uniref:Uncharacterized protein n=1 Tax=Marinigracilibium pacificum TaxID=2729599 RepID=A0A848IXF9_9BACT|nr:hypothetical protein [Marinigracilibium pacificum]NMM48987.1 hypothetical protein [Marinigracilibium pacificum]
MFRPVNFLIILFVLIAGVSCSEESVTKKETKNPEGVVVRNLNGDYYVDVYFGLISANSSGVLSGTGDYYSFVISSEDLNGNYNLSSSDVSASAYIDFNSNNFDNTTVKMPSGGYISIERTNSEIISVSYSLTYEGTEYSGSTTTDILEVQ